MLIIQRQVAITLIVAGLCCGCDRQPSTEAIESNSDESQTPAVRLDELAYADQVIRERLTCIDALAQRVVDLNAHHVPWHETWHGLLTTSRPTPWMDYQSLWCVQSETLDHLCTAQTELPVHCINLRASPPSQDPTVVTGFSISARWQDDAEGWCARVSYHVNKGNAESAPVTEQFNVTMYHSEHHRAGTDVALTIPGGGHQLTKSLGVLDYHIVSPRALDNSRRDPRKMLASAEALRDECLAIIDEAETLIRAEIESGEAVRSVTDISKFELKTVGGTHGGDPPRDEPFHPSFEPPLPAEYELSEQQKQVILDEMLAELDRRRQLWRDHYQEIYATIQRALPLQECLGQRGVE